MNRLAKAFLVTGLVPLVAAGCTTTGLVDGISEPGAGFQTVASRTASVTGKETV